MSGDLDDVKVGDVLVARSYRRGQINREAEVTVSKVGRTWVYLEGWQSWSEAKVRKSNGSDGDMNFPLRALPAEVWVLRDRLDALEVQARPATSGAMRLPHEMGTAERLAFYEGYVALLLAHGLIEAES